MSTDMLGRCLTCGMHIDSTSALCLNCHTYAPNPMVSTVIVGGPMPSGVTITQQPAPVSATEPDTMPTRYALSFDYKANHACKLVERPDGQWVRVEEYARLRARLAEAERVTEEQVERACVAVAAANQTPWPTGDVAFDQRIHRRMRAALTAARGGG